jgi:hypothetical protein
VLGAGNVGSDSGGLDRHASDNQSNNRIEMLRAESAFRVLTLDRVLIDFAMLPRTIVRISTSRLLKNSAAFADVA